MKSPQRVRLSEQASSSVRLGRCDRLAAVDAGAELGLAAGDQQVDMALGTADPDGHPWVSPVWFASEDYTHFHRGLVARRETLTKRCGPAGGRGGDLRLDGACRRSPGRVHVGPGRRTHEHRARAQHRSLRAAVGGGCGTQVGLEDVQPPVALPPLPGRGLGALPVRVMIVRARSFSRSRVTLLLLSGSPYGRYESRSAGTSCRLRKSSE